MAIFILVTKYTRTFAHVIVFSLIFLQFHNLVYFYSDPGPDDDYKKKTRRNRTTFSNSQLAALEKVLPILQFCGFSKCDFFRFLREHIIQMLLSEKN